MKCTHYVTFDLCLIIGHSEDDELPCPKCRAITKVKEGGVNALPVNFDLKVG